MGMVGVEVLGEKLVLGGGGGSAVASVIVMGVCDGVM